MTDPEVDREFIALWMLEEYEKAVAESGADGITYEACRAVVVQRFLDAVKRGDLPALPGSDT